MLAGRIRQQMCIDCGFCVKLYVKIVRWAIDADREDDERLHSLVLSDSAVGMQSINIQE